MPGGVALNRIDRRLNEIKSSGGKALVCFLTCGDPDLGTTERLVKEISKNGADIVELGIPFSDPLADGPSIQAASFRALSNGASVRGVFDCVRNIRKDCDTPIVLMTYFNPINRYGLERFAADAADAGADGVILTDLPPEEAADWKKAADNAGIATIFLVAPTSTKDRIALGANMASGFIYCVSRTGVTGARADVPVDLHDLVGSIKAVSDLPVMIGFGISNADHIKSVTEFADGAVVGSALVNVIAESPNPDEAVRRAGEFVRKLRE